jgi:hypothetical protein
MPGEEDSKRLSQQDVEYTLMSEEQREMVLK